MALREAVLCVLDFKQEISDEASFFSLKKKMPDSQVITIQ